MCCNPHQAIHTYGHAFNYDVEGSRFALQKGYRMGDRVLRHAMVKVVAE